MPDGKILSAGINFPGSNHDSSVAYGSWIYEKLKACHAKTGAKCVVDSAYPVSGPMLDVLIKSGKEVIKCNKRKGPIIAKEATAYRQVSEWSMQSLQGGMSRMKVILKW